MDFHESIRIRRSAREYKPDPVPDNAIERVLEAGRIAPTAANRQPIHLVVVTDAGIRASMKAVYDRDWFYKAPVIIVGCVEPAKAWRRSDGWNSAEVDIAIVMDHIILAATAEGLGTCWVCNFNEGPLRELLQIPAAARPVAMTPVGYPKGTAGPFVRKPAVELLHRERW
jgi:nitroreductase